MTLISFDLKKLELTGSLVKISTLNPCLDKAIELFIFSYLIKWIQYSEKTIIII